MVRGMGYNRRGGTQKYDKKTNQGIWQEINVGNCCPTLLELRTKIIAMGVGDCELHPPVAHNHNTTFMVIAQRFPEVCVPLGVCEGPVGVREIKVGNGGNRKT
ncbi:hypothetical protein AVEN_43661-1 [Araneus ventricosus]|uniref:Uncharacterized protein n=1 Tax=Araneus ventricosus TaxID=182803 RepID=A0A4Y2R4U6_ARAVE|nr:hypothetical protein AVEN_220894-1 [Araneus ventricosus]GBN84986.1 hypothetical protein AVEN_43661-1 [Araneus ventricosus]